MPAIFSFRNELDVYYEQGGAGAVPIVVDPSTPILAGSVDNLMRRQIARGIRLGYGTPGAPIGAGCLVYAGLLAPGGWGTAPPFPISSTSRAQIRCIGILGVEPAEVSRGEEGSVYVQGQLPDSTWEDVAAMDILRRSSDPPHGPINRFVTAPWDNPAVLNYRQYRFWLRKTDGDGLEVPFQFGGLWLGNAVVLPDGVDAQWQTSVHDPGGIDFSRGGQAYARMSEKMRMMRVSITGMDDFTAYGLGAITDPWARQLQPAWLSDAQMYLGTTRPCVLIARETPGDGLGDQSWINRSSIYGHLASPIVIRHTAGPYFSTDIEVIEER